MRRFRPMYPPLLAAFVAGALAIGTVNAQSGPEAGSRPPVGGKPLVIAHRGASGYVPEHTLAAYYIAIQQGADYIEPDLVMTKDGVLVARHENEISGTTDVGRHPEFSSRKAVKQIDGMRVEGWFTEDFTLAELKTLRVRERIPRLRPANARFDGQFEIPTFDEVLSLVRAADRLRADAARAQGLPAPAPLGIYPETKHPTYFDRLGLSMDGPLLAALARHGYAERGAPVFIQSFEVGNLRRLRGKTALPLMQLIASSGAPYDFVAAGDVRTYADLVTPAGLEAIAGYANAIGPDKNLVIPRTPDGALAAPAPLASLAHARGLSVHVWTFRAENQFLPADLRQGSAPADLGDLAAEVTAFLRAGVDAVFADHPDVAVRARDAYMKAR